MMDAEKTVFIHGNKEAFESGKDKSYACGCIANGISEEIAEEIWGQMESFASYAWNVFGLWDLSGFVREEIVYSHLLWEVLEYGESRGIKVNRSHAACYAFLACITAYMRCYWPEEFYAAMLNAFIESSDKVKAYLSQASGAKIKLLPPHINLSDTTFTAQNGSIRFGLKGIKGIKSIAAGIVKERSENGPFKSLSDLYDRMAEMGNSLDKTAIEGLAYSNALSEFGADKNQILAIFPKLEKNYKAAETDRALNQLSLFGETAMEISYPDLPPMSPKQELEKENEVLGVYLSGHPSQILAPVIAADDSITTLEDLTADGAKQYVVTGGMINGVRIFCTRNAEQMAVFSLESQFSSVPCVVFPGNMASCLGEIKGQNVAVVTGTYAPNRNSGELQFIVSSIVGMEAFADTTKPFPVYVNNKAEQTIVVNYIKANPGNRRILLCGSNGKSGEVNYGVNLTLKTLDYLSGEFRNDIKKAVE